MYKQSIIMVLFKNFYIYLKTKEKHLHAIMELNLQNI